MLTDLLKVRKRVFVAAHDGGHATERRALQLLAAEQTVTKLDQADIVLSHLLDQMPRSVNLAKRELVVILVVKDTAGVSTKSKVGCNLLHQGRRERMQILHGQQAGYLQHIPQEQETH